MEHKIGDVLTSNNPLSRETMDLGIIFDIYYDVQGIERYRVLWQRDRVISPPYPVEDIEQFKLFYKEWVNHEQQN